MSYVPIVCARYDHLELACVRRYRVRVNLADGEELTGEARDLETVRDEGEFLVLDDDGAPRRVRLDRIRELRVLTPDAEFESVGFGEPG